MTLTVELTAHEARALARVAGLWEGVLREACPTLADGSTPPLASAQAKLGLALMMVEERIV